MNEKRRTKNDERPSPHVPPPTVVILLSDKRSGSTMVQTELCRHPSIQHVAYSPHTYYETHHWLKGACVLGRPAGLFSGAQFYRGYGSRANARTYLEDCLRGNLPEDTPLPTDAESLVFEGWEALCRQYARPVFFEKSPQHIAHWAALLLLLRWIRQTGFRVRVISLVRNPMAVLYSAYERFNTRPAERQFGWLRLHANLLAFERFLDDDQIRRVRYEDLLHAPREEFAALCEFIGLPPNNTVGESVRQNPETWREDPAFGITLDPDVRLMAEQLGYSAEDVFNATPNTAAPPSAPARLLHRASERARLLRARIQDRIVKPARLRIKK